MIRFFKMICLVAVSMVVLYGAPSAASANPPFSQWLSDIRAEALRQGVSQNILDQVLPQNLTPITRVIELDRKQPEGKMTFAQYRERIVHPSRIRKGREMMRKYKDELQTVSRAYGVEPQYIVALWGIETNYGSNTGGFDVVHALATLAHDGRRSDYFKGELLNALKILQDGHIPPSRMQGSWAGAMGQSQFMPSSFLNFAVDFNQDGKKDIWQTELDVFASAANYLVQNGWHGDERWGREVRIPNGFANTYKTGPDETAALSTWRQRGVKTMDGSPVPVVAGMKGAIIQPDGDDGPAFLVYNNFRTIMHWNRSTYFATSVGLLANALAVY